MSWFPDSLITYAPSGSHQGLVVRPIGPGISGSTYVQLVGGGVSISGSFQSGPATLQVRDAAGTTWKDVGVGAESANILHLPIRIMGSGSAHVEPIASTPTGAENALPVRQVGPVNTTLLNQILETSLDGINRTRKYVVYEFPTIKSNPIYIGYAPLSSSVSSAVWTIKKISNNAKGNPTSEQWTASGSAIWTNRGSETYS